MKSYGSPLAGYGRRGQLMALLQKMPRLKIVNKRWFAKVWLVVTLIFFVIIMAALHIRNSEAVRVGKAAEQVVLAMQADDAGRIYEMSGQEFRTSVTEDRLRLVLDEVGPYIRQADVDPSGGSIPEDIQDGSKAVVIYTASRAKSQAFIRVIMVREDGEWRLYGLRTSTE